MKRFLLCFGLSFPIAFTFPTLAAQFKFGNQTLTVPDGFEVELVAQSPLVDRPVSGSFDDQGRLYLTDSSGSNEKPDKQLEAKPHRVVRLEDTHGDGHFDKTVVFADKMMFPEGCLWHHGSLYVSAPPSIWKLTDTNNDGVADVREEWHQGKTLTGCANDLHGPFLGLDGWIYWCKGAFAEQTYDLPNGKKFISRAAHIFRSPPDHSLVEPVLTGGMDNPVGVAFTAEGERILCGTFFAPGEPGHRDGLIHAIYGGVYGKVNDVTDSFKKTGDLMPVMTHMGPAAPCSVTRYESRIFGEDYRDNLFVCSFNLHKVSRHILEPVGATFKTKDSDFLTSDSTDFHPTDVIEDADGSLLVIDTGGWYKICCPTSQLSKPDLLGAVYRIRKAGARKLDDARGLKIPWKKLSPAKLAELFADERIFVQRRGIEELARRGDEAVPALREIIASGPRIEKGKSEAELKDEFDLATKSRVSEWPKGAAARQKALWALTRINSSRAREAIGLGFQDLDSMVRCVALQSATLRRDEKAIAGCEPLTGPFVIAAEERLYFELLGRTGKCDERLGNHMRSMFSKQMLRPGHDRALQHSFTYAMIESGAAKSARAFLDQPDLAPAALIALDQMEDGNLQSGMVLPLLSSPDPDLKKSANWVVGHHSEWGGDLAVYFKQKLAMNGLKVTDRSELERQLTQFTRSAAIQQLITSVLSQPDSSAATRKIVLHAIASAPLKEAPASWSAAIKTCLAQSDESIVRAAVGAARALSSGKTNSLGFSEALLRIAREKEHPDDLRLDALATLPNGLRTVEPDLFDFICANVESSKPVMVRNAATTVLTKSHLNESQLLRLTETVKIAGPLEASKLLSAFEHSTNEAVDLKLLSALKDSKGLSSLRPDLLKTVVAKYPESVQQTAKELIERLNVDAGKQTAHLDELITTLKDGDIRRGQAVFNSTKAACSTCHTMGYQGGKVGPDLTSIGTVRTERDLLESIVYPSASFVRSYEPMVVQTTSDEQYTGILRKDAPDEVVLITGPGPEVHVARNEITEMRPGTVSIMPAGLEQQLSKQELADLLAFLKATKWGPR